MTFAPIKVQVENEEMVGVVMLTKEGNGAIKSRGHSTGEIYKSSGIA